MLMAGTVICCVAAPKADSHPPHFLTIGGGYSPTGNQVSLEKNVFFFKRVLNQLGLDDAPHHVLFADGRSAERDLQYDDPAFKVPRVNQVIASLLGKTEGLAHQYRSNEVLPNGPSSVATIDQWFAKTAPDLDGDDQLFFYFTGHGGKGEKKNAQNTQIYLWNNQNIRMNALARRLDKVSEETPVVLVMVHCFSGGCANVIFKEGDPKKGLSSHNRVGFFATVHNRVAAGCTADIEEGNYQEYSTFFFEAIHGKTRLGEPVKRPDYDGDNRVSYDEAHAYALLTSNSIDISTKTSGTLLRKYSRVPGKGDEGKDLWSINHSYSELIEQAISSDRAVLDGLSAKLKLTGEDRVTQVRDLAKGIQRRRGDIKKDRDRLGNEHRQLRGALAKELKRICPELANPWHPNVPEVLTGPEGVKLLEQIEKRKDYKKFANLAPNLEKMDTQRHELERKWVKTQRFLRVAENVVLARNLPQVADSRVVERYKEILEAEHGSLEREPSK
jgi:hypothetical protein|tara:strand:- start:261 stop:1760 length:1500 start_codon:yes stop_codon:yes gene_type:complete